MDAPVQRPEGEGGTSVPDGSSHSEEARSYPGLDMQHGFLKNIRQTQEQRLRADEEDSAKKVDAAKLARSVGRPRRSTKPALQIYRPPGARAAEAAVQAAQPAAEREVSGGGAPVGPSSSTMPSAFVVMQPKQSGGSATSVSTSQASLKGVFSTSASAESKRYEDNDEAPSFTSTTNLSGQDALLQMALKDTPDMSALELTEVVYIILEQALDGIENTESMAKLCLGICKNDGRNVFLDAMVRRVEKIFEAHGSLITEVEGPTGVPRRWIAFVAFLAQLLAQLSGIGDNVVMVAAASYRKRIASVMCSCCCFFLRPPSLGHAAELDCLRSVLQLTTPILQKDVPRRAEELMNRIRLAFVQPGSPRSSCAKLLDVIEITAPTWKTGGGR